MAMLKPRRRLVISLLIVTAIVPAVLFGQLPDDSLLWRELQNTGHIPLFGILSLATLCILREVSPTARKRPLAGYLAAGFISLVAGIAIEFGQLLTHRDPGSADVMRDLAGIVAGLGIYAVVDPRMQSVWYKLHRGLRTATIALACLLLLGSLLPLAQLAVACVQREQAFPVVIDFTARWSKAFIQLNHAALTQVTPSEAWISAPGPRMARLTLYPAQYPGVAIVEPSPDWAAFETLTFAVYSREPEPVDLVLRVHDKLHNQILSDRFNQRLTVKRGENRFRIPLAAIQNAPADRSMELSQMAGLILFATDIVDPVDLYLDNMRLE
jgi:hypothetical protein